MPQYLVAIHHSDDYDPSVTEDEAMTRDIDALNDEMKADGVRVFAGGLHPASRAKPLRAKPDGKVIIVDGPYPETRSMWAVFACWKRLTWTKRWSEGARPSSPVEVGPFH